MLDTLWAEMKALDRLTAVCVGVVCVTGWAMVIQGIFFPDLMTAGGWVLRIEMLLFAVAAIIAGPFAQWREDRSRASATHQRVRLH